MKISFENFGVIKQGEIEQKPLTILCGENNTGKTYAIYAIYQVQSDTSYMIDSRLEVLFKALISNLKKTETYSFDLSIFINSHFEELINIFSHTLHKSITRSFMSNNGFFDSTKILLKTEKSIIINNAFHHSIDHTYYKNQDYHISITKKYQDYTVSITSPNIISEDTEPYFYHIFASNLFKIFTEKNSSTILLPAERAGLNLFYQELNAHRTHLLHNFNQNNFIISKYPKPIADYIDWLNLIPNYKSLKSELFSSLSTTLQNNILGGSYSFDETNSINFHLNNQKNTLPLHLTSSTVKTYFGLWFYLQHMAQEGDVLMIDEPELSLHPSNQRKIARLLAQLVNKGIKVVISTHSDYIVKEINSLIMLSQDNKNRQKLMTRFGIEEDEILSPDKVGAYLFKDNTIKPMEITSNEGIIATTFDEVIRDLSEETQTIFYEYLDEEDDE